jgi:uncharacterized protein (UPF0332 family)
MESNLEQKKRVNIEHLDTERYRKIGVLVESMRSKFPGKVFSALVMRQLEFSAPSDVVFILDDFNSIVSDPEAAGVRLAATELAYGSALDAKFEVMLASVFWEQFRARDGSATSLVRDSIIIHDSGFLLPLQELLVTGKIRPSEESVKVYFVKAEKSMKSADERVSRAVLDLYWAVLDTAHAAIMVAGITPPSPKDLSEAVRKELVSRNLVHRRCGDIVECFYSIAKEIMHRQRFSISGREYDSLLADADFFMKEIDFFIKEHVK